MIYLKPVFEGENFIYPDLDTQVSSAEGFQVLQGLSSFLKKSIAFWPDFRLSSVKVPLKVFLLKEFIFIPCNICSALFSS